MYASRPLSAFAASPFLPLRCFCGLSLQSAHLGRILEMFKSLSRTNGLSIPITLSAVASASLSYRSSAALILSFGWTGAGEEKGFSPLPLLFCSGSFLSSPNPRPPPHHLGRRIHYSCRFSRLRIGVNTHMTKVLPKMWLHI